MPPGLGLDRTPLWGGLQLNVGQGLQQMDRQQGQREHEPEGAGLDRQAVRAVDGHDLVLGHDLHAAGVLGGVEDERRGAAAARALAGWLLQSKSKK